MTIHRFGCPNCGNLSLRWRIFYGGGGRSCPSCATRFQFSRIRLEAVVCIVMAGFCMVTLFLLGPPLQFTLARFLAVLLYVCVAGLVAPLLCGRLRSLKAEITGCMPAVDLPKPGRYSVLCRRIVFVAFVSSIILVLCLAWWDVPKLESVAIPVAVITSLIFVIERVISLIRYFAHRWTEKSSGSVW